MSTEEKEELFKLEVEQLSLLEGKNVKGGGESGFFVTMMAVMRIVVLFVIIMAVNRDFFDA